MQLRKFELKGLFDYFSVLFSFTFELSSKYMLIEF